MPDAPVTSRLIAGRMVAALEAARVTLVTSVPDTWIGWLMEVMRQSAQLMRNLSGGRPSSLANIRAHFARALGRFIA